MATDAAGPNVGLVRRFMGASGAHAHAERARLLHEDFVVKAACGLPFSREYHGREGFFELRAKLDEVVELRPGSITVNRLGDDVVVARFRLTFVSRSSGESVETDVVEFYTVRAEQLVELDVYYKDASAVAGLLAQ